MATATATLVAVFARLAAVLGRRAGLIAGIAGLLTRAAVVALKAAPAAAAAVATAVVPLLAVATLVVALAGANLGRGGFGAKEALEPGDKTAGLFLGRGCGSRAFIAREITLSIARDGIALTGGGFAARFTRLKRAGLARFERTRVAALRAE